MEEQDKNNATEEFMMTAMTGAMTGDIGVEDIEYYAELGADINCQDIYNESVLHAVCQSEYTRPGVVGALVKAGADVNLRDRTFGCAPLHLAAQSGPSFVIEELVEAGADVNARDMDQYTPLMYLAERHRMRDIKYLVGRGADPSLNNYNGRTALNLFRKTQYEDIEWFEKAWTESVMKHYRCE